jgi:hypothetical protein
MSPDPGAAIDVVSNSVVDATGPTSGALQGVHHRRRLQTQWRTLPDLPTACPQAACHRRRRQPRWWTLLDSPAAPPRGLTSDIFFKLDGGCCRTHRHRPQGAQHRCRLKLGGGCYRTRRQCPPGGPPLTLSQTRWWTLPNLPAAPPGGAAIDVIFKLSGGRCWTHRYIP